MKRLLAWIYIIGISLAILVGCARKNLRSGCEGAESNHQADLSLSLATSAEGRLSDALVEGIADEGGLCNSDQRLRGEGPSQVSPEECTPPVQSPQGLEDDTTMHSSGMNKNQNKEGDAIQDDSRINIAIIGVVLILLFLLFFLTVEGVIFEDSHK
ncbi:MAG: hypothetical protein K2M37_00335 [Muribaculaceae bacterium]|nr:hypothetical protein [Muribaculaceae bacterium]